MTWRTSRYKQMVIDLLKNNDTIVVLDTETVGLKKKCQIVQFSAIRYRYEKNPFSMRDVYKRQTQNTSFTPSPLGEKAFGTLSSDSVIRIIKVPEIFVSSVSISVIIRRT